MLNELIYNNTPISINRNPDGLMVKLGNNETLLIDETAEGFEGLLSVLLAGNKDAFLRDILVAALCKLYL